ncbi:GNAT family N-acetyltransferase [Paludibacterium paludis]|uniref:N-acetyltransferase YhfO n=1 Tax=Paludibacterium paludis TaxID=1225769 RepID=A0A918NWW5_9NEIS|nr:N-acetyltransferase [Paludibacterium paludis]GGY03247.1 putative N-acetyltransferase YhfO [Paludibacterium paludis]
MTTVTIRRATLADLPAVARLFNGYRQFYLQGSDLALCERFIGERMRNGESVILLAEDAGGEAVGFTQLYPTFCSVAAQPIFVLYDLFVTPHARKTGAGRALMNAARDHAKASGAARVDLSTARDNFIGQSLYESLGYERDNVYYVYNLTL